MKEPTKSKSKIEALIFGKKVFLGCIDDDGDLIGMFIMDNSDIVKLTDELNRASKYVSESL